MNHTEKEVLMEHDKAFHLGCMKLENEKISLVDIHNYIPKNSFFHIDRGTDLEVTHVCSRGEAIYGMEFQDMHKMGELVFLKQIVHPYTRKNVWPKWIRYFHFGHPVNGGKSTPLAFFQIINLNLHADCYCTFRTTSVISAKYKGLFAMSIPLTGLSELPKTDLLIDSHHEFLYKNYNKFCRLSELEKNILGFLGAGWRAKHIAEKLFLGYENTRKQIKSINQKLELTGTTYNKASIYTRYAIYFYLSSDDDVDH